MLSWGGQAFCAKISDFYEALADHSEAPVRAAAIRMLAAAGE